MQDIVNLIASLTEEKFNELIKRYLKQYYNTPHVRLIGGPYDGGNDLEVFVNEKDIRKNIQLTVQKKGIEAKIISDVKKASENVANYSYQNALDFYTSQAVSKDKKNELIRISEVDYGITLKIIDANTLSNEADNFDSILKSIHEFYGVRTDKEFIRLDKHTKILFDVLTVGKKTTEVKKNFIDSFILSYIYENPKSKLTQIFTNINPTLNNKFDAGYFLTVINNLKSKGFIAKDEIDRYYLSPEKYDQIDKLFQQTIEHEKNLESYLNLFLSKYNLSEKAEELIVLLKLVYQQNYEADIEELKNTSNSYEPSLKKTYNDIVAFFEKQGLPSSKASLATQELLLFCSESDYLNKLAAALMFTKLFNSNQLENYISNTKSYLLLDTQILIRLLCLLYKSPNDLPDIAFKSIKDFYETTRKYKDRVVLMTTEDYLQELAGHLKDAVKLQRFLSCTFFNRMGKSNNIFFNYYNFLKSSGTIPDEYTLSDFLSDLLGQEIEWLDSNHFVKNVSDRIYDIFDLKDIKIIHHPVYDNFEKFKRDYELNILSLQLTVRPIMTLEQCSIYQQFFPKTTSKRILVILTLLLGIRLSIAQEPLC
jgi:hypothetical protein